MLEKASNGGLAGFLGRIRFEMAPKPTFGDRILAILGSFEAEGNEGTTEKDILRRYERRYPNDPSKDRFSIGRIQSEVHRLQEIGLVTRKTVTYVQEDGTTILYPIICRTQPQTQSQS